jgi:HTH-type transcriptional regulator / antitoxin HipB
VIPIGNTAIRSVDDLARAVRTRRQELEITQEELAAATGVNRRVIGELERGKGTVRLEIVLALAQALGLDVELRPRT